MSNIRTTTEEFAVSGSLVNVKEIVEAQEDEHVLQESVRFLTKKVDELIKEVNTIKSALSGE